METTTKVTWAKVAESILLALLQCSQVELIGTGSLFFDEKVIYGHLSARQVGSSRGEILFQVTSSHDSYWRFWPSEVSDLNISKGGIPSLRLFS